MAAPTPTPRVNPSTDSKIPIQDGHATLITIGSNPDIGFWEKTVQPPGYDGGDAVDTTTMHNETYRTFAPRQLSTLTEVSITAAYDPILYTDILALINVRDTITVTFPDGSTVAFYGYIRSFEPQDVEEGTQAEATIVIQPTNWDPANNVEEGPAVSEVAGT